MIRNAVDHDISIFFDVRQGSRGLFHHVSVQSGNTVTVRIELGPAQLRIDALLETLGDEMLQAFCLVMELLDRVVQDLVQKRLKQSVVTQNLQSAPSTCGRQTDTRGAIRIRQTESETRPTSGAYW